jgi:hypothetical protein
MGRFEVDGFAAGTQAVALAMGRATKAGAVTVVGGEPVGWLALDRDLDCRLLLGLGLW